MTTKHTPGPWAWMPIGEKTNGYVIGTVFDKNDKQLSGYVEDTAEEKRPVKKKFKKFNEYMDEELLYKSMIGEHEASTCNYANAHLISASPELLDMLKLIQSCLDDHRHIEFNSPLHSGLNSLIKKAEGK